jgi:hypothetical protein
MLQTHRQRCVTSSDNRRWWIFLLFLIIYKGSLFFAALVLIFSQICVIFKLTQFWYTHKSKAQSYLSRCQRPLLQIAIIQSREFLFQRLLILISPFLSVEKSIHFTKTKTMRGKYRFTSKPWQISKRSPTKRSYHTFRLQVGSSSHISLAYCLMHCDKEFMACPHKCGIMAVQKDSIAHMGCPRFQLGTAST